MVREHILPETRRAIAATVTDIAAAARDHPATVVEEAVDRVATTRLTRTRPAVITVSVSAKTHMPVVRGAMTAVQSAEVASAVAGTGVTRTRGATALVGGTVTATTIVLPAGVTEATAVSGVVTGLKAVAVAEVAVDETGALAAAVMEALAVDVTGAGSKKKNRRPSTSRARPHQTLATSSASWSALVV